MLKIDKKHKNLLDKVFQEFESHKNYKILDAGSGRTSLYFLTERFSKSQILAIVYPGDKRKINGIKSSVRSKNFQLKELDIQKLKRKKGEKFDIVLAHLLLGEATKFSDNTFCEILNALFKIKTDYLVILDRIDDPDINYRIVFERLAEKGEIKELVAEDKYIGLLIEIIK